MRRKYPTIEELEAYARGNWLAILARFASDLTPALNDLGKHVDCPFHGGKTDFRIDKKKGDSEGLSFCTCGVRNGWSLLKDANDWSIIQAKDAVAEYFGLNEKSNAEVNQFLKEEEVRRAAEAIRKKAKDREEAKLIAVKNNKVWKQTLPLNHHKSRVAAQYLRNRKLDHTLLTSHVRFHPHLSYWDEDEKLIGYYPALVARVYDNSGRPIALHRTYLDQSTCQKVEHENASSKKLMPVPELWRERPGRVIPATKAGNSTILGIAEGLETALAASMATGISVWSSISAGPLKSFVPPSCVNTLVIFADLDKSKTGSDAADELVKNLQKLKWLGRILIMTPDSALLTEDSKSVDWADVWFDYGYGPFKSKFAYEAYNLAA